MSNFQIGDIVVIDSQHRMRWGEIGCIKGIDSGLYHVGYSDRLGGWNLYHPGELRPATHEEKLKFVGNAL